MDSWISGFLDSRMVAQRLKWQSYIYRMALRTRNSRGRFAKKNASRKNRSRKNRSRKSPARNSLGRFAKSRKNRRH